MARIAAQDGCAATLLSRGWSCIATPPGAAADPARLPSGGWLPAPVPGTVAQARAAAGLDITADLHAEDHWYRLDQPLPPGAELEFEGLATVAEVWLDGVLAAGSDSMFLPLRLPLPHGAARLELCFRALRPLLSARRRPAARWHGRLADSEGLRLHRTTLLGHMPGWSPPLGVVGPFRPVRLHLPRPGAPWARQAGLRVLPLPDGGFAARLRLCGPGLAGSAGTLRVGPHSAPLRTEGAALAATLALPGAPLWWPHTHGTPALLPAEAVVAGQRIDLGLVGLRHVERQPGEGFGLRVNGVPVFCRGALWTGTAPAGLPALEADRRPALERARDANMNMLRVPGFALYETDGFFADCDALGLLVWHDFMFARFDYPSDPAFLASAGAEARHFLHRTEAHPSLAVLCGGAEVAQSAAMAGRPPADWSAPLFDTVLADEAAAAQPALPYVPHAPLGAAEGGLPFAAEAPVAHYFGVGGYLRPVAELASAGVRFAAECLAFSNPPDPAGCRALGTTPGAGPRWRAGVPRDLHASWDFEDVRDHYLEALFGLPAARLRREDPDSWLAHGRAAVALVLEEALDTWRTDGRCAGALVLMLQDHAPGAGWGVVDHRGRVKSAWHALRRAGRPLQVVLRDRGQNGMVLHAINEGPAARDVVLSLRGLEAGGGVAALGRMVLALPPHGAQAVPAEALCGGWRDLGHAWRFGPPPFLVLGAVLEDAATGARLAEATHFPAGPRLPPGAARLQAEARPDDQGGWRLRVQCSGGFAQFVQLDDDGFTAAEDHFHLWPGEGRDIALHPVPGATRPPAGSLSALNLPAAAHYRVPA